MNRRILVLSLVLDYGTKDICNLLARTEAFQVPPGRAINGTILYLDIIYHKLSEVRHS